MAYNPDLAKVMLFGGRDATVVYNETWVWDGTSWAQQATATVPGPRRSGRMVWDVALDEMVMFGGSDTAPDTGALNDTWLFQQINPGQFDWRLCQMPACGTPGGIVSPGLGYDGSTGGATSGKVIEFGGTGTDSAPKFKDLEL